MLSSNQHGSKAVLRKVVALVLLLPLLVTLVKLPTLLAITMSMTAIASSIYGVWFAISNAGRWLTIFAVIITLLNLLSMATLGTPSVLRALYIIVWLYAYPPFSNWLYWNF
ncbi:hypothetical protein HKK55_03175 [Pseudomonas sp. ADAK18]|uniref:hypothetical protein n=1 Tax=Pseudomonas sp. ADAK18 TaxID=2730848 RepID=UPI0014646EDA|nr:hypothetical protein [Pseudomonas sp. ADAK18]QJI27748.1 hypothetical protein HKK55_03175 [Pseudomonas sp. ADAK18]